MKRIATVLLSLSLSTLASLGCDEKRPAPSASTSSASSAVGAVSAAPATSAAPSASAAAPKTVPDAIAAQHVLVTYKGAKGAAKSVTRSKADARKRAEEVVTKAKGPGADFGALVAEYSDDPGSKERMGSVGKFTREKMTKPFSDAAFALAVDEVSGVVESDFGFHVIKRNQ